MERLKKIFSSVLGIAIESINPETSPENTPSWDSLNAIVLVSEVEKEFNIKFDYNEVMAVKDFKGVIELVRSKGVKLDE